MSVQEAIDLLSKIKSKDMQVFVDCPHCGHPMTIEAVKEIVLLQTKEVR